MVLERGLLFNDVPRKAICARCGASFDCLGSSDCWCATLGGVDIEYDKHGNAKACLCKDCLRAKARNG